MRVAVEEGLENVRTALIREGIEVTKITSGSMSHVQAAVVTGLSSNVMGISDTHGNRFPIIQAEGRTAEQIVELIRRRVPYH